MTSVFQARRRAEDFAAAIDGDVERTALPGQEFTTLLQLVEALRDQRPVAPRAEFASDLRSRLMAEAATTLRPQSSKLTLPNRPRGRRERRLVAAASAFVLIGGTTTMAAAAQGSLPGEALYPIKRGIERAEAGLSLSSAGKGRDLLGQASDRLDEVGALVAATTPESSDAAARVPETLQSFSSSARDGSDLLFEDYEETGNPESIVTVRTFTADAIADLKALAPNVPADAQDELTSAAILLRDIDEEASALCSGCSPELPALEVPGIFLARADVDRALARASASELENSHPVVVRRDVTEEATRPQEAPSPAGTPLASPTPGDSAALPSPTLDPSAWPSLLPGLDGKSKGGSKSGDTSTTGDLTQDLQDGLDGVVSTILPDLGGTLD